jgi:hypothetical protein
MRGILLALLLAIPAIATTNVFLVVSIPSGTNIVEVGGFQFDTAPSNMICSVSSPSTDGLIISATPIIDTITTNSVTVELDGITDSTGYTLSLEIESD